MPLSHGDTHVPDRWVHSLTIAASARTAPAVSIILVVYRAPGTGAGPSRRCPQSGAFHSLAGPMAAIGVGVVDNGAHFGGGGLV